MSTLSTTESAAAERTFEALRRGDVESMEVSVTSDLPQRRQAVRISRRSKGVLVAETTVTAQADSGIRADIFRWNDQYPLVMFRLRSDESSANQDRELVARLQIEPHVDDDEFAVLVRYLGRLADRLEYEVERGADRH